MSIRLRLVLALIAVSLIPIAIVITRASLSMDEMVVLAEETSREALELSARQSVRQSAYAVARQIRLYLDLHPELDVTDLAALQADPGLTAIAVQPVGSTGYSAVFDENAVTRFHTNPALVGQNLSGFAETLPEFWAIYEAALDGSPAEGDYDWLEADGTTRPKYMAVAPVDGTALRVAATAYIDELSAPAVTLSEKLSLLSNDARFRLWVIGLVGVAIAGVLAVYIGARLTQPLAKMATAAEQVAQGDWESIRPLPERTELGALSRSLYTMTNQLRNTQENLEKQVNARTKELTRRTKQLEAAAAVAREASAIRDLDRLLNQAVNMVAERFDVYHVGVFLVDEPREYVVLYAANSEGGRLMLERGYKLRLGAEGMVGWVANSGQPRIAFDVGADQNFVRDAELPQTRSEATLPLRVRERVIGVLDVQSVQPSAFSSDDLGVLQIVADQIALAVENARLFESSQQTLQALSRLYSRESQEAWQKRLGEHPVAFRYNRMGTQVMAEGDAQRSLVATSQIETDPESGICELLVPVLIRGQVLGQLKLRRDAGQPPWTQADVAIVEQALAQIAPALENARLLEEVQSRAAREQMVNIITSRVRSSITMETILQNAVRELGMALGASRAFVQVGMDQEQGNQRREGGLDENQ